MIQLIRDWRIWLGILLTLLLILNIMYIYAEAKKEDKPKKDKEKIIHHHHYHDRVFYPTTFRYYSIEVVNFGNWTDKFEYQLQDGGSVFTIRGKLPSGDVSIPVWYDGKIIDWLNYTYPESRSWFSFEKTIDKPPRKFEQFYGELINTWEETQNGIEKEFSLIQIR